MGPPADYTKSAQQKFEYLLLSNDSPLDPASGSRTKSVAKVSISRSYRVDIFIFNIGEIGAQNCGAVLTLKFHSGKKCFVLQSLVLLWAIYTENMSF